MINSATISRPYAKAILALTRDNDSDGRWLEILEFLSSVVSDAKAKLLLSNLAITHEVKAQFLCEVGDTVLNQQAKNFIRILAKNKRLLIIPVIYRMYYELLQQEQKKLNVRLITAHQLDKDLLEELRDTLVVDFSEQVILQHETDPKLIAGGKIKIGDRVVNSSVQNRLRTLYNHLIR